MTLKTDINVIKYNLLTDLYFFTRYFYAQNHGQKFIRGEHFQKISDTLEQVYLGNINRLIINMPPRFGKTEMAVINFIAKGIAINPKAKFIHTSYSESLALENSEKIKDLILSDAYKELFGISLKRDSTSKGKWYTAQGGGLYATSSGGQLTGFGAGTVGEQIEFRNDYEKLMSFGGAIVIDDPLKPEDAESKTVRERINERFYNTIMSRTNSANTPIIVIAQRLHNNDLPGELLSNGDWEHLNLPARQGKHYLWEYKKDTIDEIESTRPYVFMTQYQQEPTKRDTGNQFLYAYNDQEHYKDDFYTVETDQDLWLSFDFNKDPCTLVVSQYDARKKTYNIFDIITANHKEKISQIPLDALCLKFLKKYVESGLTESRLLRVTGDITGLSSTATHAAVYGNYSKICKLLGVNFKRQVVLWRKVNLPHTASRDLCNDVLYRLKGHFFIWKGAEQLAEEMKLAYADDNGSLNECKAKEGLHTLDCGRYQIDAWFRFENYSHIIDNFLKKVG